MSVYLDLWYTILNITIACTFDIKKLYFERQWLIKIKHSNASLPTKCIDTWTQLKDLYGKAKRIPLYVLYIYIYIYIYITTTAPGHGPLTRYAKFALHRHRKNSPVTRYSNHPRAHTVILGGRRHEPPPPPPPPPLIGPVRPYCSQSLWSCSGVSRK